MLAHHRKSRTLPTRLMLASGLLLLVIALCGQQWAVASHWHAYAAGLTPGSEAAPDDSRHGGVPQHDCVWSHATSNAGADLPPKSDAEPFFVALQAFLVLPEPPAVRHDSLTAWSWQSRGPPAA